MDKNLKAWIKRAVKAGPDMRRPEKLASGSDYEPPPTGIAWARFVNYFELGKHEEQDFNDKNKTRERDKVQLSFELFGPKHPLRENGDPQRISVVETLELTEVSSFRKLFLAMNYDGEARHMAELLGRAYLVEIFHKQSPDGKKTYANLKGPSGYNIKMPVTTDVMTGDTVAVPVPEPYSQLKIFVWSVADKAMWDQIYIDGEYAEQKDEKTGEVTRPARSKNVIQRKIMEAINWPAHPLYATLQAGGVEPDLLNAETLARAPQASAASTVSVCRARAQQNTVKQTTTASEETMTEKEMLDLAVKAVEIYASRHPRPAHVTLSQAAEMLGRSRPTVKKLIVQHRIKYTALGSIPIEEIDKLLAVPENW